MAEKRACRACRKKTSGRSGENRAGNRQPECSRFIYRRYARRSFTRRAGLRIWPVVAPATRRIRWIYPEPLQRSRFITLEILAGDSRGLSRGWNFMVIRRVFIARAARIIVRKITFNINSRWSGSPATHHRIGPGLFINPTARQEIETFESDRFALNDAGSLNNFSVVQRDRAVYISQCRTVFDRDDLNL